MKLIESFSCWYGIFSIFGKYVGKWRWSKEVKLKVNLSWVLEVIICIGYKYIGYLVFKVIWVGYDISIYDLVFWFFMVV